MTCATLARPVVCGRWHMNTMRSHILQTTRDTIIGSIGTIGSLELSEWNAIVGIAVGLVTGAYMTVRLIMAARELLSGWRGKTP